MRHGAPVSITTDSDCIVQNTQSNGDAVKGLCEQIEGVYAAIRGAADAVGTEIDQIPDDCPNRVGAERKLRTGLNQSLTTPTDDLQACVRPQAHGSSAV